MKTTLLALTITMPAFGLPILGEDRLFPNTIDIEPVRIKIDLEPGSTVEQDFDLLVDFENLEYSPGTATALPTDYANGTQVAGRGHFHVYGSYYDGGYNQTNVFLGASAATLVDEDTVKFDVTLPENGQWLLYVESQFDDHTSRVRPHPQQIGAWDATWVNVVPEPGTALLLGAGALLLLRRRR